MLRAATRFSSGREGIHICSVTQFFLLVDGYLRPMRVFSALSAFGTLEKYVSWGKIFSGSKTCCRWDPRTRGWSLEVNMCGVAKILVLLILRWIHLLSVTDSTSLAFRLIPTKCVDDSFPACLWSVSVCLLAFVCVFCSWLFTNLHWLSGQAQSSPIWGRKVQKIVVRGKTTSEFSFFDTVWS